VKRRIVLIRCGRGLFIIAAKFIPLLEDSVGVVMLSLGILSFLGSSESLTHSSVVNAVVNDMRRNASLMACL